MCGRKTSIPSCRRSPRPTSQMISHSFFMSDTKTFFDYYKNNLVVPEEPSRPSTDFFHTQTPRCASWNQDPDLPATRAVPPANTLNTIRVFFSTGTKEGLPVPRLPFKTYTTALPHSLTRDTPHQQSPL